MPGRFDSILDLFFPRRSITGREGEWVTPEEMDRLRADPVVLESPALRSLGLYALDRVVAAADYRRSPLLHRAIHLCKYRRMPGLLPSLVLLLTEASHFLETEGDERLILTPVPLHWTRKFWRGFNQADLLARGVADARGWIVFPLLRRRRRTHSQVGLDRAGRQRNIIDAFVAERMPARRVILVDDLFTTGATLHACAEALKRAGVERVEGLVIARG